MLQTCKFTPVDTHPYYIATLFCLTQPPLITARIFERAESKSLFDFSFDLRRSSRKIVMLPFQEYKHVIRIITISVIREVKRESRACNI